MSTQHTPGAGVEISLRIGQRVRHQDYQGQRVTGVVQGLSVEDRALMVDMILDAPIVIPAMGEYGPTKIFRQHVPAHELAPFDEREELIAELLAALEEARNGLRWYQERCPEAVDGSDDEAAARIDAAIAKATGSAA